jgi:hypothetical protein
MRFLVLLDVRNNFPPDQAVAAQVAIGAQIQKIRQSGKVKELGIFAEKRGGFILGDFSSAEELFDLTSPIKDIVEFEAHALVSPETLGKFFEEYAHSHQ